MSMITIMGKVVKVFDKVGTIDKETNEKREDTVKLQLMGEVPVNGGDTQLDIITLRLMINMTHYRFGFSMDLY